MKTPFLRQTVEKAISPRNVLRLVGVGVFVVLLSRVNLGEIAASLTRASVSLVVLGYTFSLPLIFLRAVRWNVVKQWLGIPVSLIHSFLYQWIGSLGFLTPGRLGEFVKAVYLKAQGHRWSSSLLSILWDRLMDLLVIVLVAGVGVVFLHPLAGKVSLAVTLAAAGVGVLCLGLFLFFLHRERFWRWILKGLSRVVPSSLRGRIHTLPDDLPGPQDVSFSFLFVVFVLTLGAFALQVFRILVLAWSLHISIPFHVLAGIVAIMAVVNLLPITFSGIGTRDAVFLYFFTPFGIEPAQALALSFLILLTLLLNTALGSGLFLIYPPEVSLRRLGLTPFK